jgi:Kdo2-lipid IVA lauroyltransferase/acyltransferase
MSSWAARVGVGFGVWVLRAVPERWAMGCARLLASAAWALGIRRRVALDNLRHAFPTLADAQRISVARQAYASMSIAMLESIRSDLLSAAALDDLVRVTDWKGLDRLLEARQPVLIASAHLGSWELFAEVMARRGFVFSAVVRPLRGAFNDFLVRSRRRAGVELILQRGALSAMLAALKRGHAVVQLIDQAVPGKAAVWVPFFGRPASTTAAVSMAALRSKAPVYVVTAARENGRLVMSVDGPFPVAPNRGENRRAAVRAHTGLLTAVIESHVRKAPGQWLWLHRRWKKPSNRQPQQHARLQQRGVAQR